MTDDTHAPAVTTTMPPAQLIADLLAQVVPGDRASVIALVGAL